MVLGIDGSTSARRRPAVRKPVVSATAGAPGLDTYGSLTKFLGEGKPPPQRTSVRRAAANGQIGSDARKESRSFPECHSLGCTPHVLHASPPLHCA